MQDRQGADPGIRYLRRVHPSPHRRDLTTKARELPPTPKKDICVTRPKALGERDRDVRGYVGVHLSLLSLSEFVVVSL
jgi:hypothetical protein